MANSFGADTTAEEAAGDVDLSGKTIVLTGGSAGLGVEVARGTRQARRTRCERRS